MESQDKNMITVSTTVHAPAEKVWNYWTAPEHIVKWNNASDDWHTPKAESDLREGGKFVYRMEAKDESFGFDFYGTYDVVTPQKFLEYTLGDGRKVEIIFSADGDKTKVEERFEAETQNALEMQKTGWQAILDNFKKYTEEN